MIRIVPLKRNYIPSIEGSKVPSPVFEKEDEYKLHSLAKSRN
jgi:hypothetical protein